MHVDVFDSVNTYNQNDMVVYTVNGEDKLYKSLNDNNVGNAPDLINSDSWQVVSFEDWGEVIYAKDSHLQYNNGSTTAFYKANQDITAIYVRS